MKKLLVVYWSGTGNTETMAKAVAEGAKEAGAEISLKAAAEADAGMVRAAEVLAFGCPAMGDEILEDTEMEPFISGLSAAEIGGKSLGLFGSYDWGDCQWMRDWEKRMKDLGANILGGGITANLVPGNDALEKCRELGRQLAT